MNCPSCKSKHTFKPIKLNGSLPARECPECKGILIDLLSYRAWREKWQDIEESIDPVVSEVANSSSALLCPKCSRVMLKYRIGSKSRNTVDVCSNCDDAWLDNGEWELLGALALQSKLTNIFTEPWQQRIKAEQIENQQYERDAALIGSEEMTKIEELISWLDGHPKRQELLRILRKNLC